MEFNLTNLGINENCGILKIIGKAPKCKPYVKITINDKGLYIEDKDLEKVAINILKALKSKKLKPNGRR